MATKIDIINNSDKDSISKPLQIGDFLKKVRCGDVCVLTGINDNIYEVLNLKSRREHFFALGALLDHFDIIPNVKIEIL